MTSLFHASPIVDIDGNETTDFGVWYCDGTDSEWVFDAFALNQDQAGELAARADEAGWELEHIAFTLMAGWARAMVNR